MPSLVTPALPPGTLSAHPQPVLGDGALRLRPWAAADVPGLVSASQDPEIQRWHARSMSEQEASAWVAAARSAWAGESAASWAVDDEGSLAGRMTLSVDMIEGTAVAACWTIAPARGRGVATAALGLAASWAFGVGVHRIELEHSTLNEPSCRVAHRAGFDLEGIRRDGARHADGWHDMHLHARIDTPTGGRA